MDDALAFLNDGRGRPEFRRQRLKICEAFIAQQKKGKIISLTTEWTMRSLFSTADAAGRNSGGNS